MSRYCSSANVYGISTITTGREAADANLRYGAAASAALTSAGADVRTTCREEASGRPALSTAIRYTISPI